MMSLKDGFAFIKKWGPIGFLTHYTVSLSSLALIYAAIYTNRDYWQAYLPDYIPASGTTAALAFAVSSAFSPNPYRWNQRTSATSSLSTGSNGTRKVPTSSSAFPKSSSITRMRSLAPTDGTRTGIQNSVWNPGSCDSTTFVRAVYPQKVAST